MELSAVAGRIRELLEFRLFTVSGTPISGATLVVFALILLATALASRGVQKAVGRALRRRKVADDGAIAVTQRLLHYGTLFIGVGIGLHTIGINLTALFAAGAIFAIGLGFAMQTVAQNFVSGIIILVERSITPGDVLRIEERLVRVDELGIRATVVRTLDDEDLIVPNSTLIQATVTNYTLRDSSYRLRTRVGVSYASDMRKVMATLEDGARELSFRVPDRDPVVQMVEFGDSAVIFDVSIWIDDPWRAAPSRSALNQAIWWALQEAGITIAFPQMDLHLDPEVVEGLGRPRPTAA